MKTFDRVELSIIKDMFNQIIKTCEKDPLDPLNYVKEGFKQIVKKAEFFEQAIAKNPCGKFSLVKKGEKRDKTNE